MSTDFSPPYPLSPVRKDTKNYIVKQNKPAVKRKEESQTPPAVSRTQKTKNKPLYKKPDLLYTIENPTKPKGAK